jgi:hypothetical protein
MDFCDEREKMKLSLCNSPFPCTNFTQGHRQLFQNTLATVGSPFLKGKIKNREINLMSKSSRRMGGKNERQENRESCFRVYIREPDVSAKTLDP